MNFFHSILISYLAKETDSRCARPLMPNEISFVFATRLTQNERMFLALHTDADTSLCNYILPLPFVSKHKNGK